METSLHYMTFLALVAPLFPVVSTLLGGYVVYRWKRDLHPWLSFSGGLLLGVAFLHLLPEGLEQAAGYGIDAHTLLLATLGTILAFHIFDKLLSFHAHHEHVDGAPPEHCDNDLHRAPKTYVRVASMIFHSALDGVAIGGGFAVDTNLGILVLIAVMMHDFSDGMSTMTLLKSGLGQKHRSILPVLFADAIAPFFGAFVGYWLAPQGSVIAFLLAGFAGFFIFLALSDLLPQAHSGRLSRRLGLSLTMIGVIIVWAVRRISHV